MTDPTNFTVEVLGHKIKFIYYWNEHSCDWEWFSHCHTIKKGMVWLYREFVEDEAPGGIPSKTFMMFLEEAVKSFTPIDGWTPPQNMERVGV